MTNMTNITTYKNVFCEEDYYKIWSFLNSDNWKFGHVSDINSKKKFWVMELNNNCFFSEHLFNKIKKIIGDNYIIERVYANGQTYGLNGEFHYDSQDNYSYTFLYYPSIEWRPEWQGCTVIVDDENLKSFYPLPNTAIMFPGKLLHCGNGPSREFYNLRISIAYKLLRSS